MGGLLRSQLKYSCAGKVQAGSGMASKLVVTDTGNEHLQGLKTTKAEITQTHTHAQKG